MARASASPFLKMISASASPCARMAAAGPSASITSFDFSASASVSMRWAKRKQHQREKRPAPAEERACPEKNQQPRGRAEQRDHRAAGEEQFLRGQRLLVEKRMAIAPHVGVAPDLKRRRRQRRAGERKWQRGPTLRQVAVLGLEPEIAEQVVGVAGGEVRDFV